MIINREHKATIKQIKVWLWNGDRYVDIEEQSSLDKYRWTQVLVNLGKPRKSWAEQRGEVSMLAKRSKFTCDAAS